MDIRLVGIGQEMQELMTSTVEQKTDTEVQEILENVTKEKDDKQLKKACQEVESYMIYRLFKQMKQSTTWGERLIPKGDYEEVFEDFLTKTQAEEMTKAGGIGLADMMYQQLSRQVKA